MLTLKHANTIVERAFAAAAEMKTKPLAVVVVDAAGNIVSAQRQDQASMFRFDVALGKAWAAVAMGASSRALAETRAGQPQLLRLACGHGQGQVPAADRRGADQGRERFNSRRGRRERRDGR